MSISPNLGSSAGSGRIRIDTPDNRFAGTLAGTFSIGFQPIILPAFGNGLSLVIQSIGDTSVAANPTGNFATPDVVVSASTKNPVQVIVRCSGLPLNTAITVTANSANGPAVSASGLNSAGTLASSTATILLNLPRGSGLLHAKASVATGGALGPKAGGASATRLRDLPLAQTGLTTDGERIATVEVEATLGGPSRTVYVTESGKRIPAPSAR